MTRGDKDSVVELLLSALQKIADESAYSPDLQTSARINSIARAALASIKAKQ